MSWGVCASWRWTPLPFAVLDRPFENVHHPHQRNVDFNRQTNSFPLLCQVKAKWVTWWATRTVIVMTSQPLLFRQTWCNSCDVTQAVVSSLRAKQLTTSSQCPQNIVKYMRTLIYYYTYRQQSMCYQTVSTNTTKLTKERAKLLNNNNHLGLIAELSKFCYRAAGAGQRGSQDKFVNVYAVRCCENSTTHRCNNRRHLSDTWQTDANICLVLMMPKAPFKLTRSLRDWDSRRDTQGRIYIRFQQSLTLVKPVMWHYSNLDIHAVAHI